MKPSEVRKPEWSEAPEWAMWLAQDFDGAWWWYANEPQVSDTGHNWMPNGGRLDCVDKPIYYENMLAYEKQIGPCERRPEE